jgi:hypothetical protein
VIDSNCPECRHDCTNRDGACLACGFVYREPTSFDDTPLPVTPLADFSHITWISLDGDEVDELVPWHVQAAQGLLSFRGRREWFVASVVYVVPTKQRPPKPGTLIVCFVVMRETIAP